MTIHLRLPISPLDAFGGESEAGPSRFAHPSSTPRGDLDTLVSSLCSSKRIVCINGAGISTDASIPDFRGSAGLFSLNTKKGKESVKDLFHVKSLHSPSLLAAHHDLISQLATLSHRATPTPFHLMLKQLDDAGKLLRVYTQNIDGLEEKTGLRTGLPMKPKPTPRKRTNPPTPLSEPVLPPRVIPLHGTLQTLNCSLCHFTTPLLPHLPLPPTAISCPECQLASTIRQALCERQRRLGSLRPSIVLYGEDHHQGDLIGSIVERDLRGTGGKSKEGKIDFLIVAGTSLSIPGVKRIIKEFAKVLNVSKGKSKRKIKTVLVNNEPPKNTAEWVGVFDIWLQGDIQSFAALVTESISPLRPGITSQPLSRLVSDEPVVHNIEKDIPSTPKKTLHISPPTPVSLDRVDRSKIEFTPIKRKIDLRGENWLPTPRATPPSPSRKRMVSVDPVTPSKKQRFNVENRALRDFTPVEEYGEEFIR